MRAIVLEEAILMKKMDGRWKSLYQSFTEESFSKIKPAWIYWWAATMKFPNSSTSGPLLHGGWDVTVIYRNSTHCWMNNLKGIRSTLKTELKFFTFKITSFNG